MNAPSVFNFFRPGYTPPQSQAAALNLVAPEMQLASETSAMGYANFIASVLNDGWGQWNSSANRYDLQFDLSQWDSVASSPSQLLATMSTLLLGQALPDDARAEAEAALTDMPASTTTQKRKRTQAAILLVCVSPSFMVQQ